MKLNKFQILLFRINCKLQKRKYAKMPAIGQRTQITRSGKPPVNVILHPPKNQSDKAPVFVQIHGGAWVGLDAVMDEEYCQRISNELGAYVVNINYKKLNEKPFPYQQMEVVDTVKWLIANAEKLNIDPNRIVISGGSAGGHITAGAAIMLAEEGIQIAGQIMEVPFLDFISGTSDEKENTWDLARQLLEEFSKDLPMDHRIVSPLRAPDEVLKKVCPAVVIVCGRDILHEQGQAYAARLEALGVDTQLKMYENGTHGFGVDDSLPEDAKQAQPILREECYQYKKEMMLYLWNKAMERAK